MRRAVIPARLLLLVVGLSTASCNALTGADDLQFRTGGSGDSGDDPPPPALVEAAGVSITEVALYQGIKRPLMQGGALAQSDIPVVAGKSGMLRVFVHLDGYDGQPITARLQLSEGGTPIDVIQTLQGDSSDDNLASTINFQVPGELIGTDFRYHVMIGRAPGGAEGTGAGTYPVGGFEQVGAQSSGPQVRLMIVPIKYNADGSGRIPDTSDNSQNSSAKAFFDAFLAMYPVAGVEISVHAPVDYNKVVSANGSGWDQLLNFVGNLRQQDGAPPDQYYYGIFNSKDSFGQFCGGGCVLGLGNLGQSPHDGYSKAAIGIGFDDPETTITAQHEIGHTHGRQHTGCSTPDKDPGYPHSGGLMGVWGYDQRAQRLWSPQTGDIMGYCEPTWISDYTFDALFNWIKSVNGARLTFPAEQMDLVYDQIRVGGDDGGRFFEPIRLHEPPLGQVASVTVTRAEHDEVVEARYYPYDHLPGGVLVVPQGTAPTTRVRAQLEGSLHDIARADATP